MGPGSRKVAAKVPLVPPQEKGPLFECAALRAPADSSRWKGEMEFSRVTKKLIFRVY